MQKIGFTALTLNSIRTPTSSVTRLQIRDSTQCCSSTFNYTGCLRANVHRRGVYEAINGFCGWLNAQVELRYLISAKAICSIIFPLPWTLFLSHDGEEEYATGHRHRRERDVFSLVNHESLGTQSHPNASTYQTGIRCETWYAAKTDKAAIKAAI